MYCSQCGQRLDDGARYCRACGAAVIASTASAPPVPSPYAPPSLAPEAETPPASGADVPEAVAAAAAVPSAAAEPPRPAWMAAPSAWAPAAHPATAPPAYPGGPPVTPFGLGAPSPFPVSRVAYAGFWRRFWALVLDGILLRIALFPIQLALGLRGVMPFLESGDMTPDRMHDFLMASMSMGLVGLFVNWVYFAAFHASPRQATPGQMALGLRVTGMDGGRIGYGRASGRYFASLLSAMTLLVGYLMSVFTARRQTLHDLIAGTLVVRDGGAS